MRSGGLDGRPRRGLLRGFAAVALSPTDYVLPIYNGQFIGIRGQIQRIPGAQGLTPPAAHARPNPE